MERKSARIAMVAGIVLAAVLWAGVSSGQAESFPYCQIYGTNCFNPASFPVFPADPFLVQVYFPIFNSVFSNSFSFGSNNLSGLNTINASISGVTGIPFAPLVNPLGNMPAASSSNLNFLLGLAFGGSL